ncbi:uncharacterized protein MELLADRAFT_73302 [Melampsora larici-populina 98AG31]|uniref:Matrin-type domain-containing protein n=1 Tax=Melampsora larici-populina (strain 98AG31 / pathotype 3-4-7) TaxID=747676 RepID=F4S664_MELLP|nr:uncharacterized protein MELLADRAFT_73302 [Melampsora larici-populina 98AG31]EGF99897.1 hypothetical protein MELLADRAFT_73302 [Melampsora larici-populina 98AG31]
MTEYWVSKQSYYCKYCEIYIRDDKPSRAQHENGLRHKGNLERYIRDIYKKEERTNHEKEEERRMIEKINLAANLSHETQDRSSTSSKRLNEEAEEEDLDSKTKRWKGSKSEEWKGAQDLMNYSDAKSLGLVHETEEGTNEETPTEQEIRMTEGFIGKWEIAQRVPKPLPASSTRPIPPTKLPNNESIHSKLSNQFNSDLEPPSKLFGERKPEVDHDPTKNLEIKLKKKTNVQLKQEEEVHSLQPILPFRLDGLQSEETLSNSVEIGQSKSLDGEDDEVKPDLNLLDDCKPLIEEETKVLFKKRKPKANSTLRQKS